jgi:hypothetical protein
MNSRILGVSFLPLPFVGAGVPLRPDRKGNALRPLGYRIGLHFMTFDCQLEWGLFQVVVVKGRLSRLANTH